MNKLLKYESPLDVKCVAILIPSLFYCKAFFVTIALCATICEPNSTSTLISLIDGLMAFVFDNSITQQFRIGLQRNKRHHTKIGKILVSEFSSKLSEKLLLYLLRRMKILLNIYNLSRNKSRGLSYISKLLYLCHVKPGPISPGHISLNKQVSKMASLLYKTT